MELVSTPSSTITAPVSHPPLDCNLYLIFFLPQGCSTQTANPQCQTSIFVYDAAKTTNLYIYNLNTIGSTGMAYRDTTKLATNIYNYNVYPSTIFFFRSS